MYESLQLAEISLDPVQVCQDANDKCVLVMMFMELELVDDVWDLVLLGTRRLLGGRLSNFHIEIGREYIIEVWKIVGYDNRHFSGGDFLYPGEELERPLRSLTTWKKP